MEFAQSGMPEDVDDYDSGDGMPQVDLVHSNLLTGKIRFLHRRLTKNTDDFPALRRKRKVIHSLNSIIGPIIKAFVNATRSDRPLCCDIRPPRGKERL